MQTTSNRPPICLSKLRKKSQTTHQKSKNLQSSRDIIRLKGSRTFDSSKESSSQIKIHEQSKPLLNITLSNLNQSNHYPESCRNVRKNLAGNANYSNGFEKFSIDIQNQQNEVPFLETQSHCKLPVQSEKTQKSSQNTQQTSYVKSTQRINNLLFMITQLTEKLRFEEQKFKKYESQFQESKIRGDNLQKINNQMKQIDSLKQAQANNLRQRVQQIQEQLNELRQLYEQYKLTEFKLQQSVVNQSQISINKATVEVQTQCQFVNDPRLTMLLADIKQPIVLPRDSPLSNKSEKNSNQKQTFGQTKNIKNKQNKSNIQEEEFWKYKAHQLKNQMEVFKLKYANLEKKFKVAEENKLIEGKIQQEKYMKKVEALKQQINDKNYQIQQKQHLLKRFLSGECRVRLSN